MTQAKEKARELVDKFVEIIPIEDAEHGETESYFIQYEKAKQCALIAADEILKLENNNGYYFDGTNVTSMSYWIGVKEEIEKL